jgi:hypothetical protein
MYTHIWQKYLPVIRILLKKSAIGEQKTGLNKIDFEKGSRSGKPSCTFTVVLEKGRFSVSNPPAPAKELVALLMADDITKNLLRHHTYKISLNADFFLRIINMTPAENSASAEPLSQPA